MIPHTDTDKKRRALLSARRIVRLLELDAPTAMVADELKLMFDRIYAFMAELDAMPSPARKETIDRLAKLALDLAKEFGEEPKS